MHIAIDARIIKTSTGRYVEQLLVNLEKIDTKNTYSVLVLAKDKDYWKPSSSNFHIVVADFPNYSLAEQVGFYALLRRLHPDLVHFCMPQQPLLYMGKRVTTVHDLTLVRFENIDGNPLIYKLRKLVFTGLLKNVIKRSAAIITPTEYVRKDILDFTSIKLIPYDEADYALIERQVTVEAVRKQYGRLVQGNVTRYELPKLKAFNFVLEEALQGGVTDSLNLDTHGKSRSAVLLAMMVEVPDGHPALGRKQQHSQR